MFSSQAAPPRDRATLIEDVERKRELRNEYIRRLVINGDRIDVLAQEVLGYTVVPKIHGRLARHQMSMSETLSLIFRGAGKTTIGTTTKIIHLILKFRDIRILLCCKTAGMSKRILREVRGHFEANERFREIFGDYVGTETWSSDAICVAGISMRRKEPTVQAIGVLGAVVSGHYDVIIGDDLVTEENSRTQFQREKLKSWYYTSLIPTLNPPEADNPIVGQIHLLGTRYHHDDLYGWLQKNEMKGKTLIVRALERVERDPQLSAEVQPGDEQTVLTQTASMYDEESPWPERYPVEFFRKKRATLGSIIFNSQYQCDTELMKGEIFDIDDCKFYELEDYPKECRTYMGVDLAISQGDGSDMFAIVVLGIHPQSSLIFVRDYFEGRLRFAQQTAKIIEMARRWNPVRIGIETNAYQEAQYQALRDSKQGAGLPLLPLKTFKDKITRANKLSARFEAGQVFFLNPQHQLLIDHLVLFPGGKFKDLFDAFDMAVTASQSRARRRRLREPSLI